MYSNTFRAQSPLIMHSTHIFLLNPSQGLIVCFAFRGRSMNCYVRIICQVRIEVNTL